MNFGLRVDSEVPTAMFRFLRSASICSTPVHFLGNRPPTPLGCSRAVRWVAHRPLTVLERLQSALASNKADNAALAVRASLRLLHAPPRVAAPPPAYAPVPITAPYRLSSSPSSLSRSLPRSLGDAAQRLAPCARHDRLRTRARREGGRQPGGVQYDDALQLGKVQWDIVCELAAGLDDPENAAAHLDEAKAAALLDSKLAPLQAKLGVDLSTISHHA